jgi:hypothetical protein
MIYLYLQASDWDELRAVARYFEEGGPELAGISSTESLAAGGGAQQEQTVRAPDSSRRDRLIGGPSASSSAPAAGVSHMTSDFLRERTAQMMQRAVEIAEPGVHWMFSLPPDYPVSSLMLHEVSSRS